MYLSNAIFALSAMVTLISSAPIPDAGNNRIQVSESQLIRFTELIVEGDNPEALLNFIKEGQFNTFDAFSDHLPLIVEHNRFRSFEFLMPVINLDDHRKTELLFMGLLKHRPEICDLLLSSDFTIVDIAQVFPFRTRFWMYRLRQPFSWNLEELVNLINRHPRLVDMLEPKAWRGCATAERGLLMVEFLRHLHKLNLRDFDPNKLLHNILDNYFLSDEDMTVLVERLREYGAQVDKGSIKACQERHQNHVKTIQALQKLSDSNVN